VAAVALAGMTSPLRETRLLSLGVVTFSPKYE
jgi:hypothetical protein